MTPTNTVTLYDEGKIDIHNRKVQYQRALAKLESNETIHPDNKRLILDFIRDCTLGKTVKRKSKKKIGPARCLKYISILTRLASEFGKQFDSITQKDMERLVQDLEEGRILTVSQKPFGEESKADYKKVIKKFWKWKDGSNSHYPELVEWLDTSVKVKEIPALSREEVDKLIDASPSVRQKALIMVLFDSGARIEELLNVRLKSEHVMWKEDIGCYMIRLEFSKTKPRTISLPLSTKHLRDWLKVHPAKDNPQAQLFPIAYANLRMILYRLGKKVLDKRVTAHVLRHTSATYFANKLNHYQLCYRYGWTMSSDQVNRYIDRAGILEKQTTGLIRDDEIAKAKGQSKQLSEESIYLKEQNALLQKQLEKLTNEFDNIESAGGFMSLLRKQAEQQEKMAKVLKEISGKEFDFVVQHPSEHNHSI